MRNIKVRITFAGVSPAAEDLFLVLEFATVGKTSYFFEFAKDFEPKFDLPVSFFLKFPNLRHKFERA